MSSLLALPTEIRGQILDLVVSSLRTPPLDQDDKRFRVSLDDVEYLSPTESGSIAYEVDAPLRTAAASGPLATNHKLREDTLAALDRYRRRRPQLVLDVMFWQERYLVPTWLTMPVSPMTRRIRSVDVYFRINKKATIGRPPSTQSIWRCDVGKRPHVVWMFYSLLERFLKAGPIGPLFQDDTLQAASSIWKQGGPKIKDREFTVEEMNLDFVTCDNECPLAGPEDKYAWFDAQYDRKRCLLHRAQYQSTMRPEWLAEYLEGHMRSLLDLDIQTFRYGTILYERVGRIVFKVDGVVTNEFNLGEMLATARCDPTPDARREQRFETFKNWKAEALRLRQERGLSITQMGF